MATGFQAGVPIIDWSSLADIPKAYREGQARSARNDVLSNLQAGKIDYGDAAGRLLQAGDMEGGLSLAKLHVAQQQNQGGVYGTPIYGTGADGKTVLGAITKDGQFKPIDTGGVTVNPGIKTIDTGTGTIIIDSRTGLPVRRNQPAPTNSSPPQGPMTGNTATPQNIGPPMQGGYIPKDVAGEAAQRTEGTETGKAVFSLPQTVAKADQSIYAIDRMIRHPGRETATGLSGVLDPRNYIPGTNAKDFRVGLDQLKGQAFLQAFESLKGGGQITEVEGAKATAAMARLDTAQSDREFKAALIELRTILSNGKQRAIEMARQRQQPQQARQPQQQSQPVRVNTPDEARRLPSGTPIMLPDGSIGRVP